MSTLIPKRSRSKRPRPSHVAPAVISSAPYDVSTDSTSDTSSVKSREAAQKEDALLKSTKTLVYELEELFSHNVTLSDPRVQVIRRQVENVMPKLYEISQDHSPAHTSSETSFLMRIAEDFLKKFPDPVTPPASRPHSDAPPRMSRKPSSDTDLSPATNIQPPSSVSPPLAPLSQPATPNAGPLPPVVPSTSHPVPTAVVRVSQGLGLCSAADPQSLSGPLPVTAAMHPSPSTPSQSAVSAHPASYPDTRMLYPENTAKPLVWGSLYDAASTPSHLHDAVKQTTQHQKMVLFALHELLRKRSSRHERQPWYEPPVCLSPEELVTAQERRSDPRLHHVNFGGQYAQYRPPMHPPTHSSATGPYAFPENRSITVGRSVPRSSSMG